MQIPSVSLPTSIKPCPVRDAIVELRFEAKIPIEVFLGLLYEKLKNEFLEPPKKTSILEIPATIRDNDKNLMYAPHYQFENDNFLLKISPRSLSISPKDEYPGWLEYFGFIKRILAAVESLDFIYKVNRIGVRYVSFFENIDIFENLKMKLELFERTLVGQKNILRSEFSSDDFICVLQVTNYAITNQSGIVKHGSSIDIDTIREDVERGLSHFNETINDAHQKDKSIFFSLLTSDFLNSLNPEY